MYSKTGLSIMKLVLKRLGFCLFFCMDVCCMGVCYADSSTSSLTVKPNQCIALQQGQSCYATLHFQWVTPASGEYCLFDERQTKPLVCWTGNTMGSFKQKFKSDENVNFEIRSKLSEQALADALVKISWVYKSNTSSTSRWRLF